MDKETNSKSKNMLNLKELKKELLNCHPNQRQNKTLDRTDILNVHEVKSPSRQIRINQTNSPSRIFSSDQIESPQRIRENNVSSILSNQKDQDTDNRSQSKQRIRTYENSINSETNINQQIIKQQRDNPYKIKDHGSEWFYLHEKNPDIKSLKVEEKKVNRNSRCYTIQSPKTLKIQQFNDSEVFGSQQKIISENNCINNINSDSNSKRNSVKRIVQRSLSPFEKKVLSNNSSLFQSNEKQFNSNINIENEYHLNESFKRNDEQYGGIIQWRDSRFSKNKCKVNESANFDQKTYAKEKKNQDLDQSSTSPFYTQIQSQYKTQRNEEQQQSKRLTQIKKQNHNFSDLFGLEYGSKRSISRERFQNKVISTSQPWHNVDSVKHRKDMGSDQKHSIQSNNKSRFNELKSTLDTHQYQNIKKNEETKFSKTQQQFIPLFKKQNRPT